MLRDAEPVQHVGHQLLEAHVLHAGHALGAQEVVGRRGRRPAGACARCRRGTWSPRRARGLPCGSRRRARRRRACAPRMHSSIACVRYGRQVQMSEPKTSEPLHSSCTRAVSVTVGIGEVARIAEDVHRLPADRRQEHLEVAARDELRIHAARLLEQRTAQVRLDAPEAPGDAGQPPHRLDRGLGDGRRAVREQDAAVGREAPGGDRLLDLGQVDVRLGHRDGRPDVVALRDMLAEDVGDDRAERIDRDDLLRIAPLRDTARSGRSASCWSGRACGRAASAPAATASARYTPYEPLCVPMTLRWLRLVVLPITGPRSCGSALPHSIGRRAPRPRPGCDVRRMCFGLRVGAHHLARHNRGLARTVRTASTVRRLRDHRSPFR